MIRVEEVKFMTIIDFLMDSDPAVKRMTKLYLLGEQNSYTVDGWIGDFLSNYDVEKNTWGNGIYSPKWTSTFYTLRDLKSLEIDPMHQIYQQGLKTLISHMWNPDKFVEDDICVVAMLVSLLTYGQCSEAIINEMVQSLLSLQMPDGGWNCAVIYSHSTKSSIHTTLSVLEAYADYQKEGYSKEIPAIKEQELKGQDYLLRRKLMYRESTNEIILPSIVQFHFPTRWKYDVLRVLSYFAGIRYPYEPSLEDGLNILKKKIERGYLTKGTTYPGKIHFPLNNTKIGAMNTLRGLFILKYYDVDFYYEIISKEIHLS